MVPTASVRFGSFIGENTVLMPSFVNIGAFVGNGTMVDTWATVGSCAQIGENVHLSGELELECIEPLKLRQLLSKITVSSEREVRLLKAL